MLQARHRGAAHYFVQGCKLLKSEGDSIRALQELDNALAARYPLLTEGTIDLTLSDEENLEQAKVRGLLCRWGPKMLDDSRHTFCGHAGCKHRSGITRPKLHANTHRLRRSGQSACGFKWFISTLSHHTLVGKPYIFTGACIWIVLLCARTYRRLRPKISSCAYTRNLCYTPNLTTHRHVNYVNVVVRQYGNSLLNGSKYLYQTLPRMLTLWLDLGERAELNPKTG